MTTVGKFTIDGGSVTGPADYMGSESYRNTVRKIESGTHCLIATAPTGTPIESLIGVIVQTDYAAWNGSREFFRAAR